MEEGYFCGLINEYFVIVGTDNVVSVFGDAMQPRARETVPGLNDFVRKAGNIRIGWGQFPDDGDEVIYLYDSEDDKFGYAVNLDDPQCSEWGYAPF
jgi:hypothetical protein